jgi:hypothetical protein
LWRFPIAALDDARSAAKLVVLARSIVGDDLAAMQAAPMLNIVHDDIAEGRVRCGD